MIQDYLIGKKEKAEKNFDDSEYFELRNHEQRTEDNLRDRASKGDKKAIHLLRTEYNDDGDGAYPAHGERSRYE